MKKNNRTHRVTIALLRIERVTGSPQPPFVKPFADMDFWFLSLEPYTPETLVHWQTRVIPIIRRHIPMLRKCQQSGARCFLHVQTVAPTWINHATFSPKLLKTLVQLECTLETVTKPSS